MPAILRTGLLAAFVSAAYALLPAASARACGYELPISCIDPDDAAQNLLKRAVVAVKQDKARALA